jgi:hypothetical protein
MGATVLAGFQPCSSKRPTNSRESTMRKRPMMIPAEASQASNAEDLE